MRNSTIPAISAKQRARNRVWKAVSDDRAERLGDICEWCCEWGSRCAEWNALEGHHMRKRRFHDDTEANCFICHERCHEEIGLKNIKVYRGIKGVWAEGDERE